MDRREELREMAQRFEDQASRQQELGNEKGAEMSKKSAAQIRDRIRKMA